MGILYRDAEFIVGLSFWKKRTYVKQIATNRKVFPETSLIDRIYSLTRQMEKTPMTAAEKQFVGPYLMSRFAAAALAPTSLAAQMFCSTDPDRMISSALAAVRQ